MFVPGSQMPVDCIRRSLVTIDRWLTIGKVEGLRGEYHQKVEEHRRELSSICRRLGWTFAVHHTDTSPHHALLSLYGRLSGDFRTGRAGAVGV